MGFLRHYSLGTLAVLQLPRAYTQRCTCAQGNTKSERCCLSRTKRTHGRQLVLLALLDEPNVAEVGAPKIDVEVVEQTLLEEQLHLVYAAHAQALVAFASRATL